MLVSWTTTAAVPLTAALATAFADLSALAAAVALGLGERDSEGAPVDISRSAIVPALAGIIRVLVSVLTKKLLREVAFRAYVTDDIRR